MTNRDIMVQILSEASFQPAERVRGLVDKIYKNIGYMTGIDDQVPDENIELLLAGFRKEFPGIRQWLIKGRHLAEAEILFMHSRMQE